MLTLTQSVVLAISMRLGLMTTGNSVPKGQSGSNSYDRRKLTVRNSTVFHVVNTTSGLNSRPILLYDREYVSFECTHMNS